MLKAVLFDMDGVLVNSEDEYFRQESRLLRELGVEFTQEEHVKFSGVRSLEMLTEQKEKHGFDADPQVLADRLGAIMEEHYMTGDLQPFEPSLALLRSCADSGLKTAIATSSNIQQATSVVRRLGLAPYVQAVSTSCQAGKSKPEPDIFLLAAEMLGTSPDECVVIEDAKCGLMAAKAAGMKAVGLRHADRPTDLSLADAVVDSLGELSIDMLKAMI